MLYMFVSIQVFKSESYVTTYTKENCIRISMYYVYYNQKKTIINLTRVNETSVAVVVDMVYICSCKISFGKSKYISTYHFV